MSGDYLVVLDAGVSKRLLDPATRMDARTAVVAMAYVQGRCIIHFDRNVSC
jgi:hypothetical protein